MWCFCGQSKGRFHCQRSPWKTVQSQLLFLSLSSAAWAVCYLCSFFVTDPAYMTIFWLLPFSFSPLLLFLMVRNLASLLRDHESDPWLLRSAPLAAAYVLMLIVAVTTTLYTGVEMQASVPTLFSLVQNQHHKIVCPLHHQFPAFPFLPPSASRAERLSGWCKPRSRRCNCCGCSGSSPHHAGAGCFGGGGRL